MVKKFRYNKERHLEYLRYMYVISNPCDRKMLVFIKSGNIFNGSVRSGGSELETKVHQGKEASTFVRGWISA